MYDFLHTVLHFYPLQLILAEYLFAFWLKKRKYFFVLLPLSLGLYILATWFIPYLYVYGGWLGLKYIVILTISLVFLWISFAISWKECIFCATAGYSVQHIAFNVYMILFAQVLNGNVSDEIELLCYFLSFFVVYCICFFIFARRIKYSDMTNTKNNKLLLLIVITVFVTQFLSMWLNHELLLSTLCRIYAISGSVLILIIQFSFFREGDLEKKNEILQHLLEKEKEQYEISKDNINIINMKCHDLKKNINLLKALTDEGAKQSVIKELERAVLIYDSVARTDNEALDILLMDKSLRCNSNHIRLSYMIDGARLNFIEPSDIFSLFGNALDNAIERELKEAEENRYISLKTSFRSGCIYIHMENYCSVTQNFENGLPVTDKQDKVWHGFGTQSIQYIVKKYKGTIHIYQENNSFNVDILFPGQEGLSEQ